MLINFNMFLRVVMIFLLCAVINVENVRILGVFHIPSFSHCILGKTLLEALAKRGHQVTMISPFPQQTPVKNYEDIYLDEVIKFQEDGVMDMLMEAENGSVLTKLAVSQNIVLKMNEIALNHTLVKNLLSSNISFDLIIMDWVLNEAMLGVAHHFKAPAIVISAIGSSVLTNKITANPAPYAYVPNLLLNSIDEMTFPQRITNTVSTLVLEVINHFYQESVQEEMLQQFFPNAPPLQQLIENISLVFLNTHFSIESPRPYVPNMIQIAGMHIGEPREHEKELKKFIDEASEGVLYFSLGSNAKSAELNVDKLDAIIKTLGKLPVKVLWKFESDEVPDLPSNVRTGKWLPQIDILVHPNIKIFVTHGGLFSITEAVYHGVPMVTIPCFADQKLNAENSAHNGYSIMVTLDELTEQTLTGAIMEVLKNPRYRENVKKRSLWLRDQPVKPLEKAIFWVEYVLRHKGAPHLQTRAVKLSWYQYLLLDVFVFLIGILLTAGFVLNRIVKMLVRAIFQKGKRSKETNSKKAKKD